MVNDIAISGVSLVFEVLYWHATLSCPLMASNCAPVLCSQEEQNPPHASPHEPPLHTGIRTRKQRRHLPLSRTTLGIPATCHRTENAQIPKSAGESAGKSAGKKRTAGGTAGSSAGRPVLLWKSRETALLPAVPPAAVLFFPALFPALSPALLGIWAFSVL